MRTPCHLAPLILAASLALGCSTTRIVESWTAPGTQASDLRFEHVVAIAAVPQEARQRIAEDALVATAERTKVTAAYTIVSQADRASVDRLREVLSAQGIDGAITVRLVGVEDRETYVPGSTRTYPGGYYGYYRGHGAVVYEPGYYRTDTYVVIETSLHDVAKGELLWSGVSETINPSKVDELIAEVVEAAGKQLAEQGLLP